MRYFSILIFLISLMTNVVSAEDIAGSQDHPIITRYPGSVIEWYSVDNYRPYKVPIGPVTGYRQIDGWIETEGRVTRIYYALDGGARSDSEVYKNYQDALITAGFSILAEGLSPASDRGAGVGSRKWREVMFTSNPWTDTSGAVNEMGRGSATSGGGGTIVARKERAAGTAYVIVTVYQFRADRISTLIDIVEVEAAETGLVVVDAEAIGSGIEENGRVVLDGILFDFDKATLKPESNAALQQIAAYLKQQSDKRFYVVGHTDSKGTFDYNQNLSAARAQAVVDALKKEHGIAAERLDAHGVGPLTPVFANASDRGRDRNRRVELVEQ